MVLRALHAQTESRHFKVEVTISIYFIQTIPTLKDGFDPVKDCYCQCKTGARTVGCCTYIASVLWYLEPIDIWKIHLNTIVMLIQNMKWMQLFDSKHIF